MSDDNRPEVAAQRMVALDHGEARLVGFAPGDAGLNGSPREGARLVGDDGRGPRRDVLTPVTDERRVVASSLGTPPRDRARLVGSRVTGLARCRRRPRRTPRGLMELSAVAAAFTDQAGVRGEQRQTLRRSAEAVEEVSARLRRQSEEPMLDGIQGDPARVAYLTLALHLRDTADAISGSLDGLELAERAMQEAHEEFRRIEKIELAPAHRSLLALGEPIVVSGVGMLTPAAAQQHWMTEVGKEQKVAARQAMQRFEADMARAASLMRPVEVPTFDGEDPTRTEPIIVEKPRVVTDPQPAPDSASVAQESPSTGAVAGGGAAGAAAAGAARFASARRGGGGGGGHRSAGGGSAGTAPRDTWVSTRAQHDTGPDGSMSPAAASSAAPAAAAPTTAAAAAGGAAVPFVPGSGGGTGGEAESGTAIVRSTHEDEAAAAIVAAASSSGSRSSIEAAPAESEDW
ncbi:hypothetical protein [Serinibacter arcticus]|uniref:Uncharacterized protein n=1 Tax=Serinibacter arcticus TaxID=1655435 RepID=A0A4Z1E7D9_9MICO|nr:hypothetical protein [Serinibacter arcticus]TGO06403.1 hypothetical protein SERN_0595 [Serinibacter arcticus]